MPILAMVFSDVVVSHEQMSKDIHRRLISSITLRPDPQEWIEIETLRRTYFCIYTLSGLITLIFASPPVVTTVDARGLLLPCNTAEWGAQVNAMTWVPPHSVLYDEAMMALWSKKPIPCSEFG